MSTRTPPRAAARSPLPVTLAALAALLMLALTACTGSAQPLSTAAAAQKPPAPPVMSKVMHWGAFFGGMPGMMDRQVSPVTVTLPGTVAEVASSNAAEYALMTDGAVYAWGLGTQGELGDGAAVTSFAHPVRVQFPAGVRIASLPSDVMPYDSGLAVDTQGHAWGWGRNGGGEFCLGHRTSYLRPVRLPFSDVTAVAGASNHAIYDAGGHVYACGQNVDGDLGDGSRYGSTTPKLVARLGSATVTQLVASFANSGALLSDGKYYDWGYNAQGQLGDGVYHKPSDVPVRVRLPLPVVQVAEGGSIWGNGQTVVMLSDGALRTWGADASRQLGTKADGPQDMPVRLRAPAGVSYRYLASGSATSYAVTSTGGVYAWGTSFAGQLGDGGTVTSGRPVLVARNASGISATANNVVVAVGPAPGVAPGT